MTIILTFFIVSVFGLILLGWVSGRRQKGKVFRLYEDYLQKADPKVKKATFRVVRRIVVVRQTLIRGLQKWGIVLVHIALEIIHFMSAKLNKGLARMKYKTQKKAREIKDQKPSEFLRQVKEGKE